ncbi:MAG: hypothetical protein ACMUIE_03125 [Thermoplasmatota archaeon]
MVKCVERDMRCPNCRSEVLSYSTDIFTLEESVSCWDCGKTWIPTQKDEELSNPTWRKVLKMEQKYC